MDLDLEGGVPDIWDTSHWDVWRSRVASLCGRVRREGARRRRFNRNKGVRFFIQHRHIEALRAEIGETGALGSLLKKVGRKSRVALTPRQVRLARGGASTCKEDVLRETRLCHLDWTRSRRPRLELHEWPAFALHMYRKGIPPSPSSHQPEAESSPSTPPASNCQRPSSKSSHLAATSSNVLPAAATSQTLAADGSGSQQKQPAPSSQHQPAAAASSSASRC